jgi:hypothetical protein
VEEGLILYRMCVERREKNKYKKFFGRDEAFHHNVYLWLEFLLKSFYL